MPAPIKSLLFSWHALPLLFCFPIGILGAQTLTMVSGNGQIVPEDSLSNAPMIVQAKDASGHPVAGAAIQWAITQGSGTLSGPAPATDSNGLASTNFVSTNLFSDSFKAATVTATSASGTVNFVITTVISSQGLGALFQFVSPPQSNPNLTAASGSILPAAVVDQVLAEYGNQAGSPIPNVAVQIVNGQNISPASVASCNAPGGVVLTDSTGTASCDLVVSGSPGTYQLRSWVGEQQYSYPFNLQITQGTSCSYSLSAQSQSFALAGGTGSVNVVTGSSCSWNALSNASWITITAGSTGTGSGAVSYSVAANTSAARTGTLIIAGQTYTVSQSGTNTSGSGLAITTSSLPSGTVNVAYSATLSATGGQPPYTWSITGSLPSGLTLNSSTGVISGTPTAAATDNFSAMVTDSTGASATQNFSITINPASSSGSSFAITTTSFPPGAVGQPYQQSITTVNSNTCGQISSLVTFAVSSGGLPNGLSIQASTISGTPTVPGTFSFTLTATSMSCGYTATANLSITITGSAPQMTVSPSSLAFTVQQGANNIPASQQIAVNSGSTALSYVATASTNNGGIWLVVNSGASGNTPATITAGVVNYANLAPGAYAGSISISSQAGNSPVIVPVSLTVLAPVPLTASPSNVALDQFASTGSNITQQSIALSAGDASIPFTVATTTTNGSQWLQVTPTTGTTPATLTASINSGGLAPGTYKGSIIVTPAAGGVQTIAVTLVVSAQPPSISSVVNAASFVLGPVSPGEIVTIFGSAVGPVSPAGLQLTSSGSVATIVLNTSMLFDGVAAPVIYTSPTQVSAIVPYEVAGKTTTNVQLQYQGLLSNTLAVSVAASAPGIFTVNSSGSGQGAILNQDGSVNSESNPAALGSVISIFATGEGQTNPPGIDGSINANTLPLPAPQLPVTVFIGAAPATVQYAGAAPGEVAGVLQVNAVMPTTIGTTFGRATSVPVVITIGTQSSQTVTVAFTTQ